MRSFSVCASVLVALVTVTLGCSEAPLDVGGAARAASTGTCMQDTAGFHLECTANDVKIAQASNIRTLGGQPLSECIAGQSISFLADFTLVANADRLDIKMDFDVGGDPEHDGARTGTCSANVIVPRQVNLDGDVCGDIRKNQTQVVTIEVDNVICTAGAGQQLALPECVSWRQPGSDTVCASAGDTDPGTGSKCSCNNAFTVPVTVENGVISVTKTPSPASQPEPGGAFSFTTSVTNIAQTTTVTVERLCDDRYGTVAGTGCAAGSLGTVTATDCTVPQVLAPGATYTCSFSGNFFGNAGATDTDTVTASGHDGNGGPVFGSASATVSITDVAPSATVVKSMVELVRAVVQYQVVVTNTSAVDAENFTALTDSAFGDLMTVHGDVVATTCAPRTLAAGESVTCTFDGGFDPRLGPHTNVATATLSDDDGNTFQQPSNPVVVTASATAQ